tara:strand:+ start:671 stop:1474 length:804 start_codon:yes stop_codon:yes gene_type:complete
MISYIGGKNRMAKWINEQIPKSKTYIEVFGGAFWVYLKGDINSNKIIYNDYNKFMANLFECFREPEFFLKHLEMHKAQNKDLFYKFQDYLNTIKNDNINFDLGTYLIASQYVYCATQVFSGSKVLESKYVDLKGKYNSKYDSLINKLKNPFYIDKLKKINKVENLDYIDLIKKYDSKDTFLYVDPPYYKTENYYSNHNFDQNQHIKLLEILKKTKSKWALSYYYFDLLEDVLPKNKFRWIEKEFCKAAGAQKGKKQNKGTELLIMNY